MKQATPMIGRMLGHYRISEKLGQGGMGEVYRAHDEHLKRDVAIKVLPPGLLHEQSARRHFREEALLLSRLCHPNIETVHDFDTQDGVDFLVIEYIPGQNLSSRLDAGPLPAEEVVGLGIQLAEGLEAAHAQGVVHRDLKPANLLVTPNGRLKILDFGLARLVAKDADSASTESSMAGVGGTVPYMAPEQLRGELVDARSDIYSAGLVLYEMATGKRAYHEKSPWMLWDAILHKKPPSSTRSNPSTPPRLARIISKCVEKQPEHRYQSARELTEALRPLVTPESPTAGGIGAAPIRARRLLWTALALALTAGGIGGWLMISSWVGNDTIPAFQPTQVTADPAWEIQPAISPDGARIAYVHRESGRRELRVIDLKSLQARRLTDGSAPDEDPGWFPDSETIAYSSDHGGGIGIWKIGIGGGQPSLLLRDSRDPAVSPDGKWLAFTRPGPRGFLRVGVAPLSDTSRQTILTRDEDGLWNHADPAWSPDGKTICYSTRHNLWVVSPDGRRARQLTTENAWDLEPVYSPDGRHVYFSSYRHGGTLALWRVDAEGRSPERVTLGMEQESRATISADGIRMSFSKGVATRELVVLDRASGRESRLPYRRDDAMAAIAPDKSKVVIVSSRGEPHANLWLYPLDEGVPTPEPRRLTRDTALLSHPGFSPDGRWIAYYRISGQQRHIWVISADGGVPVQFTSGRSSDIQPAWSPDGSRVAFVSDRGGSDQIWVAPVDEGKPSGSAWQLTSGPTAAFAPAWSPDGATVAFIGSEGEQSEVWLIRSDGGVPARRLTSGAQADRVRWDPWSKELLVSGSWGGELVTLRQVSAADGRAVAMPAPVVFGLKAAESILPTFDLSADGQLLVYCRESLSGDIWLLQATKGIF